MLQARAARLTPGSYPIVDWFEVIQQTSPPKGVGGVLTIPNGPFDTTS